MCIELFVIFSDDGLNFCGICGDFPFIVFYFIYLVVLSSFLSVWLVVCLFCWSFQKTGSWIYWFFWRVFRVSISFSSALILVISCLLLGFEFFWSCSSSSFNFDDRVLILDLSSHVGTYCYIFSSRDCFKCVPEILVCYVFVLIGFEELFYFCLHFIVYPVNIQERVVQFPWSCVVLS